MTYSVYPYYNDANYSTVYLYDDADRITADFLTSFPELDGVGGMNAAYIKTNLIQKLAVKFVPSYFLKIAINYYQNTEDIEDLAETNATKLSLAAFDPDANPCKLTITSAANPMTDLERAQLEFIFSFADRMLGFFLFGFWFDDTEITYGKDKNQILGNLSILNFGGSYNLYQLPNAEIANFKARLAQYIDFTNPKDIVLGNQAHLNLFASGVDQGSLYLINQNQATSKYNIKSLMTPRYQGDVTAAIVFLQWIEGRTIKSYQDLLSTFKLIQEAAGKQEQINKILGLNPYSPAPLYGNLTNKTPYYWVDQAGVLGVVLGRFIPGLGGGGVGGRGRADSPSENIFLWNGNKIVAYAIGLPPEVEDKSAIVAFGKANQVFKTNTPSATYEPDAWLKNGEDAKFYGIIKKKTTPVIEKSLNKFPLLFYFKKFKGNDVKRKNKPFIGFDPPRVFELPLKDFKYIDKTAKLIKKKMKGDGDAKVGTPGVVLNHRQSMERENAGTVMGKFLFNKKFKKDGGGSDVKTEYTAYFAANYNPPDPGSSLPATDFVNYVAQKDSVTDAQILKKFPKATPYLKNTVVPKGGVQALRVITDQEWCHLYGHGDGGPDIPENFVSGSKHCNTEQLAIETGQRKRKIDGLTAKVTAYMLPARTVWYSGSTSEDEAASQPDAKAKPKDLQEFAMPVAHMMRYKVYHNKRKVFDHWYDAQSQSFDYNEFLILEEFVDWKVSLLDELAKYEYNASLISRFLERFFKDCAKVAPPIDCSAASFTPFKNFPSGYKTSKQKKKTATDAVKTYVTTDPGKAIYDQFKFDDESGVILDDAIPAPIKAAFTQLMNKMRAG